MSNTNTLVTEIEERLTAILSNVNDDMGEAVEVGSALSVLIKMANITQEAIKTTIRDEAIRRQNGVPGTVVIDGTDKGEVSVTIPKPKLQMVKDADVGLLFKVLGEEFDLYFETNVRYVPRKATPDLIEMMEEGTPKTVLLSSLQENEGTPRVSFKRS